MSSGHNQDSPRTDWYGPFGSAAKAIGSDQFFPNLLALLGASVPHDYGFAVRYARSQSTDILHTTGHPDHIVEEYKETYHHFDPFGNLWRKTLRKGVITSQEAIDETPETRVYTRVFQKRARINDEIGLILPFPGNSSIGLFLESSHAPFSPSICRHIGALYPAFEGLNSAHLGRQFGKLTGLIQESSSAVIPPVIITNREGQLVYRSGSWAEAVARHRDLAEIHYQILSSGQSTLRLRDGLIVNAASLPADFDVAPGGRILVLQQGDSPEADPSTERVYAERALVPLSRLETRIVNLIADLKSTGQIATTLELSKGTVKNYKQRLYRKFGVNSERELLVILTRA